MMRRLLAWMGRLSWRRKVLAAAIGVALLALLSPFVWAAYHAHVGETEAERYHSAEALTHFHACLRIWPWSRRPALYRLAARAARREGDLEQADRLLRECQDELHDHSDETVLEWAMLHAAMGDLETTAEPLRNAARQDGRLIPLVLEALTEGNIRLLRLLDALHTTDDWLRLEPNNPQAWFLRGKVHRQFRVSQAIVQDYQRVLELDPERNEARWWLGLGQLTIGEYRKAYENLEIVQRQRPNDPEVLVELAICLQRLDQQGEAQALLDRILSQHPDNGQALLLQGQLLLTQGRFAQAEGWLQRAAEQLPHDYKAQNALWDCLRQQGKTQEAERQRVRKEQLYQRRQRHADIVTRLMSERPNDPALQCELAQLSLELGEARVAEAWLLNALRLDANYVPALEALAKYYQQQGDSDRADFYHRRAQQAQEVNSHK